MQVLDMFLGGPLCLFVLTLFAAFPCQASRMQPRVEVLVRSYINTTSHSSSSSSDVAKVEAIAAAAISSSSAATSYVATTPTTTLSAQLTSTNASATITAAPTTYAWGNQTIVNNTCSSMSNGALVWTPCHVFAGTVQLSYFPQNKGNLSYPATYYNSVLDITMTSPSVYLVVNTITGSNLCGPLGPTYATQVIPMDLTDIYTLQPYADSSATTREGPPQILSLSDLETDCASTSTHISTSGEIINTHPNDNTYNRCNPRLVYPVQLKRLGYPYWKHCGNNNFNIGLFDPPGAVPTVDSLFTTSAVAVVSTTQSASPAPTAAPDQASSTSSIITPTSTTAVAVAASSSSPIAADLTTTTTQESSNVNTESSLPISPSSNGEIFATIPTSSSTPTTTSASIITVVGTNTISALPNSSGVVLGGSTASIGAIATLSDSSGSQVLVSVASSGIYIGDSTSSTFYANPTSSSFPETTLEVIATIAGQTISAAPGATTIAINGQVVTSGGAAITLAGTNAIATLGSDGLVVQQSGGVVSTYAVPAATTTLGGQAVGVVDGYTIFVSSGASVAVIGTQTVTLGSSAITLGNNDVVSFGLSGAVVQSPGGGVSTVPVVTTTTSANKVASAIASIIGASSSTTQASGATTTALPTQILAASASEQLGKKYVGWLICTLLAAVFVGYQL